MLSMKGTLTLAAAAAFLIPFAAHGATTHLQAADIFADANYSFSQTLQPSESVEFRFKATERLSIAAFSLSGTGSNSGADLANITFGFSQPTSLSFPTVSTMGSAEAASTFLMGSVFLKGQTFSIFFEDGIDKPVSLTASFATASVPVVPLPASGMLLLTALLGAGVAGARRKKKLRQSA